MVWNFVVGLGVWTINWGLDYSLVIELNTMTDQMLLKMTLRKLVL